MFYDKYIALCNKAGVKPTPVAVSFGLSSSNVAQWKKGSTPRPSVLQKIADHFDVPVSYFFEVDGQKETPPENPEVEDPVKQKIYGIIEKMSRGQLMLLLEKAQDIENL